MLYYRKNFLLAVLEAFGGSVERLKFQKYLFLSLERLEKKHYSFVPYQFGCFSFESYNDKRSLEFAGFLKKTNEWDLSNDYNLNCLSKINKQEVDAILSVKKKYKNLSKKNLLNKVYSNYPYYAIHSNILNQADLSEQVQKEILHHKPCYTEKCLFTIGYEGRSIDEYLNILIKNNIKLLCDVRKNPLSRKYGFSKKSLQSALTKLKITYLHTPELGVDSHLRKNLNESKDYEKLFSFYRKEILPYRTIEMNKIKKALSEKQRIALTCFEAQPKCCHRYCISNFFKKSKPNLKITHL